MAKLNLGRVGIVPQGDFDNTKTYSKMDMVYYSTTGSSYVSLVDNNTALPTDSTKWQSAADVSNEVAAANAAATRANTAAEAAEAVSDEVAELKSQLGPVFFEKPLSEFTRLSNGYIGPNGIYVSSNTYLLYVFTANEPGEMFVTNSTSGAAMVLVKCQDAIYDENSWTSATVVDRRTSGNNNIPTESNPMSFAKDDTIALSFIKTSSANVYLGGLYVNVDKVKEIEDDISELREDHFAWGTISQSDCQFVGNGYFSNTGLFIENPSYRAWFFQPTSKGKIYIDPVGIDTIHISRFSGPVTYDEETEKYSGPIIARYTDNSEQESPVVVEFNDGEYIGFDYSKNNLNKTVHLCGKYTADKIVEIEEAVKELNAYKKNKQFIYIADSYPIYYGDVLEIYYKGILDVPNPYDYSVVVTCNVGHTYNKRFIFEPESTHVGNEYPITISLYDSNGNLIEYASSKIEVVNPQNPSSKKNILTIGDSMTAGGQWVSLVKSMMTAQGLTNFDFIGQFGSTEGAKYQALGGYNYTRYNNEYLTDRWVWINCTHDKTSDDIRSIYTDTNGTHWRIMVIESNRLKLHSEDGASSLAIPASGTLTYQQGGTNTSPITYTTTSTQASGNPLWNESEGKVDIQWYVENVCGASGIDYSIIFLGWNDEYKDANHESWFKERVNTMITNIRTDYPNCTIFLVGVQIPSADGMGKVYGNSPSYISWIDWVFLCHHKWLQEIANDVGNAYFVDVSAQFDTEHNYTTNERVVNKRSAITEEYQVDPVHPAESGYLQFGDAIYRKFLQIAVQ